MFLRQIHQKLNKTKNLEIGRKNEYLLTEANDEFFDDISGIDPMKLRVV